MVHIGKGLTIHHFLARNLRPLMITIPCDSDNTQSFPYLHHPIWKSNPKDKRIPEFEKYNFFSIHVFILVLDA